MLLSGWGLLSSLETKNVTFETGGVLQCCMYLIGRFMSGLRRRYRTAGM